MNRFWETAILPVLEAAQPEVLAEIGSREGRLSAQLLGFCAQRGGVVHVIDPAPSFDVSAWEAEHGERLMFHRCLSLEAIPQLPVPDVLFVDGDHNWYTVFNELKAVEDRAREAEVPYPLTFFHDIHWPYGRRDLYYDPSTVPTEHRQEYARQGILPGRRELVKEGGLNGHLDNAIVEAGPHNGVLTGIEDFIDQSSDSFELVQVTGLHGLGVLASTQRLEQDRALRESVDRLRNADFLADQLRLVEGHRVQDVIRRSDQRRRLDAARRELAEAEKELARFRSRKLWQWGYRAARAGFRVVPGKEATGDPTEAIAARLRRASEKLGG